MSKKSWAEVGKDAFLYSQQLEGYIPALADWVECQALSRLSYGCDKATLMTALNIDNWRPPAEDIVITHDVLSEDVFVELSERSRDYTKRGYPFECDSAGRRIKFNGVDPWPYVFLLALSYINPTTKTKGLPTGAYILEALAWTGLQRFIGEPSAELRDLGICHHFGSPSLSKLPSSFADKIDVVARDIKEGGRYRALRSGHRQRSGDNGVDILLRRGFPDNRGAQFLFLGGCAGGENWATPKRYEVDPDKWYERNFQQRFYGLHGTARCYFLPRQIDSDGWLETSKAAGMIIDRCRLALITHKSASQHLGSAQDWTEALIGKAF